MERLKKAARLITIIAILSVFSLVGTPTPVLAIDNPDSGPFILQVDAYQNLDTDDDVLFLVRINTPYAAGPPDTAPDEPSSDALIGRIMLAGVEVLSTTPYAYYRSGYSYNTFAIYASSGVAWEAAYTINLSGNPLMDWTGDVPNVSTTTVNWHTSSSTALSQSMLASSILNWAAGLTSYWNIQLLSITAGSSVLNSVGGLYFVNVIPRLDKLCPAVLSSGQTPATYEDQDFQGAGSAAVVNQWPFDFSGMSDWMGLPDENLLHIILAAALIAFMCIMLKLDSRMSLLAAFSIIVLLAIPGFLSPIIAAATIFVAVLGLGLVFILGKPVV